MSDERVLGALDIGTNSFHLVLARPVGGGRFDVLTREKEVVRLGQGGGDMKVLADDAIERGVACLRRMRRIADSYDALLRAVATSAVREATNAPTFLRRAQEEAGIIVEVISGVEEARLIHLGVLQAVPVFERRVLLVDIGGGSTEVLIGERGETLAARSFKLGAVRLTDRFFPAGVTSPKAVKACRNYVRSILSHFQRQVDDHGFDVAVASSGTAEALARIVHAATGAEPLRTYNCFQFTTGDLAAAVARLAKHRTSGARAAVPGLDAGRADIIVAGAIILEAVASMFGAGAFTFSEAALRDGVLVDTLGRSAKLAGPDRGVGTRHHLGDVATRSIAQLAERCDDDAAHSTHVARLAVKLFDELAEVHGLDSTAREYLEAGALLANVGLVVAHSKHHLHAYYVIRNSELAGLTDTEIEVIAQIARYHRKSGPKTTHAEFAALSDDDQQLVRTLAAILRVAIGLDRSHRGRVRDVRAEVGPKRVVVVVAPAGHDGDDEGAAVNGGVDGDISLELYAAGERTELLESVLARRVEVVAG
ncbi:MAG: Ppx/GppA family phosphatase [Actinomycetota bacterium]|nr:Ppx/GppA family phosphatase [Acidimicrobiia bacterium]MDQ3469483.1 Ppx/GppA family phosphatase [Actinomycetota bacterium]